MPETPNAEEIARALLQIFKDKNVRGGDILMAGALNLAFIGNPRYRTEDYDVGLRYAVANGWLIDEGNTIRLTKSGFTVL